MWSVTDVVSQLCKAVSLPRYCCSSGLRDWYAVVMLDHIVSPPTGGTSTAYRQVPRGGTCCQVRSACQTSVPVDFPLVSRTSIIDDSGCFGKNAATSCGVPKIPANRTCDSTSSSWSRKNRTCRSSHRLRSADAVPSSSSAEQSIPDTTLPMLGVRWSTCNFTSTFKSDMPSSLSSQTKYLIA